MSNYTLFLPPLIMLFYGGLRGLAPRRSMSRLDTCGSPLHTTRRLPLHHTSPLGTSRNHRSFPSHCSTSPFCTPRKSPRNQLPRCPSVFLRGKPRTGLCCLYRPCWNTCQLGNPCSSRAESHRALPHRSLRGIAYSHWRSLSLGTAGTCLLGKPCKSCLPWHLQWVSKYLHCMVYNLELHRPPTRARTTAK